MDRYYTLLGRIDSLSRSTDVAVTTATVKCTFSGRCSPYISHQEVLFSSGGLPPEENKIPGAVLFENCRYSLLFSPSPGESSPGEGVLFETFPSRMFMDLFESVPWGPLQVWREVPDIIGVRTDQIRTRKEREQEEREQKEKIIKSLPPELLLSVEDAEAAGLCRDGVLAWCAAHQDLLRPDGTIAVETLRGVEEGEAGEAIETLLLWAAQNKQPSFKEPSKGLKGRRRT